MNLGYLFLANLTDVLIGHSHSLENNKSPYFNLSYGELKEMILNPFVHEQLGNFKSGIKLEDISFLAIECTKKDNEIKIIATSNAKRQERSYLIKITFAFTDESISVKDFRCSEIS